MPLIPAVGLVLSLLAAAALAAAAYLLHGWYVGELVRVDDVLILHRDGWRLWTGLALVAWCLLGRFPILALITKSDHEPIRDARQSDLMVSSATGSRLSVQSGGRGSPILLTHGWGLDATIWATTRDRLQTNHRVISWDLPGLGGSKAPSGALTLETLAEDLRAVIAHAAEPVVLVGHSIGGMAIQTLARDHPALFGERVKGVVLYNTTYTNPLRTMIAPGLAQAMRRPVIEPVMHLAIWLQPIAWVLAWMGYISGHAHLANRLGFGAHVTRSQLEHTTRLTIRNPPGVLAKGNLAMFRWDAEAAVANIACPILVVGGDIDIVTKVEASRRIADDGGARLTVVAGANHMGFLEQRDAYSDALLAFVRELDARPVAKNIPATSPA